jgi:methionine-S-sulfoxide reductase
MEHALFGAGCFWCVEAVFQNLKGVEKVVSGYAGGRNKNPTYKEVCSGMTGHAEVIDITFDPAVISYKELLEIFWKTHDPQPPGCRRGYPVPLGYLLPQRRAKAARRRIQAEAQ